MAWPEWWTWELELTPHLLKRMDDRGFTEVDLRAMLGIATSFRDDVVDGRFVIETRHRPSRVEVAVELDPRELLLVVVTPTQLRVTTMRERYLEVTFRKGRVLAAYLYLPRQVGAKSVRTERLGDGLLADFDAEGNAIGLELTDPGHVSLDQLNRALAQVGADPAGPEEFAPLRAA